MTDHTTHAPAACANALQRDLTRLVAQQEASRHSRADHWQQDFHLCPPTGWLNDPNGLCYFQGHYHVFYQYAPFDPNGGVKFWGHFRSPDLVHWEHLPVALCPDQPYDLHGAYSGSALAEPDGLYLYYTGNVKHAGDFDYVTAGRGHNTCLAVSRDGVTVEKLGCLLYNKDYPAGLSCHVRDPKVWKGADHRYYMLLGARTLDDRGQVLVLRSEDRMRWTHVNTLQTPDPFGYMWECPDLFSVDGRTFLAVSPQGVPQDGDKFQNIYACGFFPLEGFFAGSCTLGEFSPSDFGFDFYAPQSFAHNGRRIQIGWLGMPDADYHNPTAERGWQHCLSVPCELRARAGKLTREPVPELTALRGEALSFRPDQTPCVDGLRAFDLILRPENQPFRLVVRGCAVLEWADGLLTLSFRKGGAGRTVRRAPAPDIQSMRVLGDQSSLEIFINGGETVLSTRYYPDQDDQGLCFECGGGHAVAYPMNAPQ